MWTTTFHVPCVGNASDLESEAKRQSLQISSHLERPSCNLPIPMVPGGEIWQQLRSFEHGKVWWRFGASMARLWVKKLELLAPCPYPPCPSFFAKTGFSVGSEAESLLRALAANPGKMTQKHLNYGASRLFLAPQKSPSSTSVLNCPNAEV